VVTELKEDAIREIAGRLRSKGIQIRRGLPAARLPIPEARTRIAALLREESLDIFVSLSSEVCPEVREFDRALDNRRQCLYPPADGRHVAHLQREFANKGIDRQVLWMTSSGGPRSEPACRRTASASD